MAPAFTATDTNGKSHSLADFRGKHVVLEWHNHDCPYVKKHYREGHMQATQKWAAEKGVVWLLVVSSAEGKQGYVDAAAGNAMMKSGGYNAAAMLLDPSGTIGRAYGARTTPHMFLISPEGKVLYNGAIDDNSSGNTAAIAGSRNHIREAVSEALAGKPVSVPSSQPYGCSVKYN
jgi:peroxiredoxin